MTTPRQAAEAMREKAAFIADKWATDLQRRRGDGGPSAEILRLPLPAEATEPSSELLTAAYLSGAYDWRKKAERMKETLIKADATLELISTMSQSRGEGPTVRECGRLAREAMATICEALGET